MSIADILRSEGDDYNSLLDIARKSQFLDLSSDSLKSLPHIIEERLKETDYSPKKIEGIKEGVVWFDTRKGHILLSKGYDFPNKDNIVMNVFQGMNNSEENVYAITIRPEAVTNLTNIVDKENNSHQARGGSQTIAYLHKPESISSLKNIDMKNLEVRIKELINKTPEKRDYEVEIIKADMFSGYKSLGPDNISLSNDKDDRVKNSLVSIITQIPDGLSIRPVFNEKNEVTSNLITYSYENESGLADVILCKVPLSSEESIGIPKIDWKEIELEIEERIKGITPRASESINEYLKPDKKVTKKMSEEFNLLARYYAFLNNASNPVIDNENELKEIADYVIKNQRN